MGRCIREDEVTDSINVNAGCEQKALRNQRTKEKRKYGLRASRIEGDSRALFLARNSCCCRTEVKERYKQTPSPVHLACCLNTVHRFYTTKKRQKQPHIPIHKKKPKQKQTKIKPKKTTKKPQLKNIKMNHRLLTLEGI